MKFEKMIRMMLLDDGVKVRIFDEVNQTVIDTDGYGVVFKTELYDRKIDYMSLSHNNRLDIFIK